MDLTAATAQVRAATRRSTTNDALGWLAEGRSLVAGTRLPDLLEALVELADDRSGSHDADLADSALKTACRHHVRSQLDPSTEVLALGTVTRPPTYRTALDDIAARTSTGTLSSITLAAVAAAQQHNGQVIATLCALAGLSYRDLKSRVAKPPLPSVATGRWRHEQIAAAYEVIDAVIAGTVTASSPTAHPMRPIEHLLPIHDDPFTSGLTGWALVEKLRGGGVPLEVLIAQRAVGSAWGAHRNSTNGFIPAEITRTVCELLQARTVPHDELRRDTASRALLARVGAKTDAADGGDDKAEGGQVTVLVHTPAGYAHAVAVSVARDGGTARASGARLLKLPARLGIPCSVVLVGPGWATRNETADIARAFDGRVYTEQSLPQLADWLHDATVVGGTAQTGQDQPTAAGPELSGHHQESTS